MTDTHTLARTTDPATSHEAARSVDRRHGERIVLHLLTDLGHPVTDRMLADHHATHLRNHCPECSPRGVSVSALRTRRHELTERGVIVLDRVDRPREGERRQSYWRLADGGAT